MLTVRDLQKDFVTDKAPVRAVDSVSFNVPAGEFYTLLGPSGCGKTTTLQCIAGLEMPDAGEITLGDNLVFSRNANLVVPAHRRDIGMVFQSYAIWPHMTVFENVAFPLLHGRRRVSRSSVNDRVMKTLQLVQLAGLENRPAPFLSGGQQQRVALARAVVDEPKVLLLDEPLSNLDAKLREEMRFELRDLVLRLHITTLYVTHDQIEALSMSDRIAVMSNGKIDRKEHRARFISHPKIASSRISSVRAIFSKDVFWKLLPARSEARSTPLSDRSTVWSRSRSNPATRCSLVFVQRHCGWSTMDAAVKPTHSAGKFLQPASRVIFWSARFGLRTSSCARFSIPIGNSRSAT
jgi:ABC-type sugar transport system ATPase subunit